MDLTTFCNSCAAVAMSQIIAVEYKKTDGDAGEWRRLLDDTIAFH
jgi:hypothetical protein